jgi:CTP synthase
MQLAAVEFARNVCGLTQAHTTEVDQQTPYPIIDILPTQKAILAKNDYGGTMRLGAYAAKIKAHTKVAQLYQGASRLSNEEFEVSERHRHRYEVNPTFVPALQEKGLIFSGYHLRGDGTPLMEYLELPEHKFYVATQAHPEFNSRMGHPNPVFAGFVQACME